MEKAFVKSWNSSKQPRKQRKYRYNAPLHVLASFVSVNLSSDLRKKYATRSVRVRKGDTVKVLRGVHRGKTGKVERVSLKYTKLYVSGIETQRKDGTKGHIPLEPSNTQIISLLTDKKRFAEKKNDKTTS